MNHTPIRSLQIDRRDFIRIGAYVSILPLMGNGLMSCLSGAPAPTTNWKTYSGSGDGMGALVVEHIEGQALSKGAVLAKGSVISSGTELEVSSGFVLASLPDQSIIKLSNRALLAVNLDSQKGGILHLKKGGLLAVVNRSPRKPYLIRNASALIGIKGTVCYSQVLSAEDKDTSAIPGTATDYFCICNGNIDFLTTSYANIKSDSAVHHNAYFMSPDQDRLSINKAGYLLNHSDSEIYDLIQQMKGEKHQTDWLFSKKQMYS